LYRSIRVFWDLRNQYSLQPVLRSIKTRIDLNKRLWLYNISVFLSFILLIYYHYTLKWVYQHGRKSALVMEEAVIQEGIWGQPRAPVPTSWAFHGAKSFILRKPKAYFASKLNKSFRKVRSIKTRIDLNKRLWLYNISVFLSFILSWNSYSV
jgi:predicted membrane protein